jgi:uncharacterized protein YjeT (DUF2065 family)
MFYVEAHWKERIAKMSEEGGTGLTFAERLFGFILLVVGIIAVYYTLTSAKALGVFTTFFSFLCVIPAVLGLVLMTAKTEE